MTRNFTHSNNKKIYNLPKYNLPLQFLFHQKVFNDTLVNPFRNWSLVIRVLEVLFALFARTITFQFSFSRFLVIFAKGYAFGNFKLEKRKSFLGEI